MKRPPREALRQVQGPLLTALVLALVYGTFHLAGLRESTCVLSGSLPPGGHSAVAWGAAYVMAYFAFVLLVPILCLGAGIHLVLDRLLPGPEPAAAGEPQTPPAPLEPLEPQALPRPPAETE